MFRSTAAFRWDYWLFNSGMVLPLRIKDGNLCIWKFLFNFPCRFFRCFVCFVPGLQLSIDCHIILFDEGHLGAYWRPSPPILLRLTLHRCRFRVLDFTQCGDRHLVALAGIALRLRWNQNWRGSDRLVRRTALSWSFRFSAYFADKRKQSRRQIVGQLIMLCQTTADLFSGVPPSNWFKVRFRLWHPRAPISRRPSG